VTSFFWHDYETFGADPARDRPAQFAGIRTDMDLNPIAEPVSFYCQPADDSLPHPEACLITGITPRLCQKEGVPEYEFAHRILEELQRPGTCGVGYNSIRFDDEVTRHLFFRNFIDPYGREWQNGNSRWDLIDVMRLAYAVRPEGLEWPLLDGVPTFKLSALTAANGLEHTAAHEALSDVHATIALAKLLRKQQPRLFQHALTLRSKHELKNLINLSERKPLFHVSSKIPASLGCCALVVPLAWHPVNANGVIVHDLRQDPSELLALSVEEIRTRLFSTVEELQKNGLMRLSLKVVHLNKCPVLVTPAILKTVDRHRLQQFGLDGETLRAHLARLRSLPDLSEKLAAVFTETRSAEATDPELSLYTGGFFSERDRKLIQKVDQLGQLSPADLGSYEFGFQDQRLETLLFRYRARNFPETLSEEEMPEWESYRYQRLTGGIDPGILGFQDFFTELERQLATGRLTTAQIDLLHELRLYGESIIPAG
jgi:exodeoxyribonuclease-1